MMAPQPAKTRANAANPSAAARRRRSGRGVGGIGLIRTVAAYYALTSASQCSAARHSRVRRWASVITNDRTGASS